MRTANLKQALSEALLALLGSDTLVMKWWDSPNKAFDGRRPDEVPLEEVRKYILSFLLR